VYWVATRVRRDEGHGPTLIISPLLALMRNQIAMAGRLGLRAVTIHSGNKQEWTRVEQALAADAVDVLLISPERLADEDSTTRCCHRPGSGYSAASAWAAGRGSPDGRRAVLD
jgi:ATP-dependent DNA helicase RecQ